ncbi:hypothetical protein GF362_06935 [Candidatus Dojkabacteria bacterium]|nr:hypothetical protein [Candidatus Dojkabacteria bacterium]
MIKNLNFDLFDVINKVNKDKYGRVTAFLALNKPVGITSHDLVDMVRKKLGTRRVGHVGALDPAASGVMLILVGRKFTKLSNDLMKLDKSYRVQILFGISTDTLDVEGRVVNKTDTDNFDFDKVKNILKKFEGGYEQYVPVYSSVKVGGKKLRVLARQSERFEFFDKNEKTYARFFDSEDREKCVVEIPTRDVKIENIVYLGQEKQKAPESLKVKGEFPVVEIEFDCSKGTYVRQFAFDVAEKVGQAGMLVNLVRTRIGQIGLDDCIELDELKY